MGRRLSRPCFTMAVIRFPSEDTLWRSMPVSSRKEGAWEFIRFLISEETQSADYDAWVQPLYRKAYETWVQWVFKKYARSGQENGVDVWIYHRTKIITEEMLEEFEEKIEEARSVPIWTASIL